MVPGSRLLCHYKFQGILVHYSQTQFQAHLHTLNNRFPQYLYYIFKNAFRIQVLLKQLFNLEVRVLVFKEINLKVNDIKYKAWTLGYNPFKILR